MILYILCGLILAYFYQATHKLTGNISNRFPAVVREIFAGLCLGIAGSFLPALMFSGEEQMGTLMKTYTSYLPLALIGIAFFKLLLTNLCIQFGLKGGHFFPVIFAGVCMGYGMAMLTCGPDGGHVVFGAAIVTASLLGGIMKKPLAVTMLLFLCFPVKCLSGYSSQQRLGANLSHSNQSRNLLQITASNRVATRQKEPLYQKTWLYASGNNYNFCI